MGFAGRMSYEHILHREEGHGRPDESLDGQIILAKFACDPRFDSLTRASAKPQASITYQE